MTRIKSSLDGGWVPKPTAAAYWKPQELSELRRCLRHQETNGANEFIESCTQIVSLTAIMAPTAAKGRSVRNIKGARTAAGALRKEIVQQLGPDDVAALRVAASELAFGRLRLLSDIAVARIRDGKRLASPLEDLIALLTDFEAVAAHAADTLRPSRDQKPSLARGRMLVRRVAEEYRRMFGALPPYSAGAWFGELIAALAKAVPGATCGPDVVRNTVKDMGLIVGKG